MNCPVCHGTGLIQAGKYDPDQPCFECHGIGQVHCCEGLQEQPEALPINELTTENNALGTRTIRQP